ncbi:hypothetical protein PESHB5_01860 [Pediococcus parvulus]
MDLSNFKTYSISTGIIRMTVAKSGISFSKTAVIRLGKPEFACILINSEEKIVVIQKSNKDDEAAAPFFKSGRKNVTVRWNYRDLLQRLEEMMNWDTNENTYRIDGMYHSEEDVLSFDLKAAQIIE